MARKKKLSQSILLRLNETLNDQLKEKADSFHVSKSTFVRAVLYWALDKMPSSSEVPEILEFDFEEEEKEKVVKEIKRFLLLVDGLDSIVKPDITEEDKNKADELISKNELR